MAWCRIGDKPLSEPLLTRFTDAYMRHNVEIMLSAKWQPFCSGLTVLPWILWHSSTVHTIAVIANIVTPHWKLLLEQQVPRQTYLHKFESGHGGGAVLLPSFAISWWQNQVTRQPNHHDPTQLPFNPLNHSITNSPHLLMTWMACHNSWHFN